MLFDNVHCSLALEWDTHYTYTTQDDVERLLLTDRCCHCCRVQLTLEMLRHRQQVTLCWTCHLWAHIHYH